QGRGGRGVMGQTMRGEDEVVFFLRCNTLGTLLFFTNKGKVYSERVFEMPEESRQGRGIPLVNIINLEPDESITALLSVPDFTKAEYCTMATRRGRIKRIALEEFESVRPSGLIAIKLDKGDELGWVCMTSGKDDVILVTRQGKALRFSEKQIRPTGRTTMGVTGIHMRNDDALASMEVVEPNGYLLVLTEKGYGKRTQLKEYIPKTRGTLGVTTINQTVRDQIGAVSQARVVQEGDEVTLISSGGIVLRTKVESISIQGRATQGVKVMELDDKDTMAAVARIPAEQVSAADTPSLDQAEISAE
ncbi:MAG: DNA gyrase C-terminal beta-propeller domain-containing protein, partial [Anaerolineaceae bacterium]